MKGLLAPEGIFGGVKVIFEETDNAFTLVDALTFIVVKYEEKLFIPIWFRAGFAYGAEKMRESWFIIRFVPVSYKGLHDVALFNEYAMANPLARRDICW